MDSSPSGWCYRGTAALVVIYTKEPEKKSTSHVITARKMTKTQRSTRWRNAQRGTTPYPGRCYRVRSFAADHLLYDSRQRRMLEGDSFLLRKNNLAEEGHGKRKRERPSPPKNERD